MRQGSDQFLPGWIENPAVQSPAFSDLEQAVDYVTLIA
jgi:hypothetical protein